MQGPPGGQTGGEVGRCCHLMGRQLWFAAEYEVVESANSPTREQRRGVVSGMVSILGLRVARLTVNIIISQDHRSKSSLVASTALSRHPRCWEGWHQQVSSSYTLVIRPAIQYTYSHNCISKINMIHLHFVIKC